MLEYNTDLFDESTMRRWAGQLVALLAEGVGDPHRRLSELAQQIAEQAVAGQPRTGTGEPSV